VAAPTNEALLESGRSGLARVQELQRRYDEVGWRVSATDAAKLRHIVLHLARTVGIIASVSEQHDHRADSGEEVSQAVVAADLSELAGQIADLVSSAAQLSDLGAFDLGETYERRLLDNSLRWAGDSELADIARARSEEPSAEPKDQRTSAEP